MKRTLMFIDGDNIMRFVEIEISAARKEKYLDYETLEEFSPQKKVSISGLSKEINPLTDVQREFINLACGGKFNDLFAGTKKQIDYLYSDEYKRDLEVILDIAKHEESSFYEECPAYFGITKHEAYKVYCDFNLSYDRISKCGRSDYAITCLILAMRGIITDRGITYGATWLSQKISDESINMLLDLADKVDVEYLNMFTSDKSVTNIDELYEEAEEYTTSPRDFINAAYALSLAFGHELSYVINNLTTSQNCYYEYLGHAFYIGNSSQLEDLAKECLKSEKNMWKLDVEHNKTELGFSEWIEEIVSEDGIENVLASYDGDSKSYLLPNWHEIIVITCDFSTTYLN